MPSRPPEEWRSASEPMTEAQAAYLKRLSDQNGVPFEPGLSKAEASRRIDELRSTEGRRPSSDAAQAPRRVSGTVTRWPRTSDEAGGFHGHMTDAQAAYLRELLEDEAEEEFDPSLSRDAAQRRIAELLLRHLEHSQGGSARR